MQSQSAVGHDFERDVNKISQDRCNVLLESVSADLINLSGAEIYDHIL